MNRLKRIFDVVFACSMLVVLSPVFALVAISIKLTSKGPVLYWSDRVGKDNKIFSMPKFRSMHTETPQVATHLLSGADSYLTPIGALLRRTSLDELPQLMSVVGGDLSIVGPRPALFNQDDLITMRTELGVHRLVPGITGWAQVNGRDELPIPVKVRFDHEYLQRQSFLFDLKIIFLTVSKVLVGEGVQH